MNRVLTSDSVGTAARPCRSRSRGEQPTILLATTHRWYPTARLAMALSDAGCILDVVCPPEHPVHKIQCLRRTYDYNGLSPLRSFERAIRAASPDLVIPADDLATWHLHDLYKQKKDNHAEAAFCQLIERSLGSAESFPVVRARNEFMRLAAEEGVRVPDSAVIQDRNDLLNWITQNGFPAVLKANGTWGGDGVKIVHTLEEAQRALRELQAPPMLARAAKRALVDRDLTLIWPSLARQRRVVNAQSFVTGHEATSAIVCWKGSVVASVHFEVIQKAKSTGHATVVRKIDHPEMDLAAQNMAKRLKLSGFHGLDFMIEAESGNAYLLEINPRTTQVGHLALGPGHDLPTALYAAVTGEVVESSPKITDNDTIALFPQEWKRDPSSPFLSSGYHDVPWKEPLLVSSCIATNLKRGSNNSGKPAQTTVFSPAPMIAPAEKTANTSWITEQE